MLMPLRSVPNAISLHNLPLGVLGNSWGGGRGTEYRFIKWMENIVDPDQLASIPADLDLHFFSKEGLGF